MLLSAKDARKRRRYVGFGRTREDAPHDIEKRGQESSRRHATAISIGSRTIASGLSRRDAAVFDWHPQTSDLERILSAYPRLKTRQRFADTCCRLVTDKPETSHDNFLRDFGERFVPGHEAVSTVDLLMNAPFEE
jgi:hypothetical protein